MSFPKVELNGQGVMRVEYPLHAEVTLESVQDEYRQRLAISSQPLPLVVVLHGMPGFTPEAQFFLTTRRHLALTSAVAIVVVPESGYYEHTKDLLSLFFARANFPCPTRVFDNEPEAVKWLLDQA